MIAGTRAANGYRHYDEGDLQRLQMVQALAWTYRHAREHGGDPRRIVVGGHSAGGHFASAVGARLAAKGSTALKGAVMFDPVAADGFSANLKAISAGGTRPVLSVAARPSVINLSNNSFGALKDLANPFVGVQLVWSGFAFGVPASAWVRRSQAASLPSPRATASTTASSKSGLSANCWIVLTLAC